MARVYIARLSHENFSLAYSEFNSIMIAEGIEHKVEFKLDEFVLFRSSTIGIDVLLKRAALIIELGKLVDIVEYDDKDLLIKLMKDSIDRDEICIAIDSVRGFGKNIAEELIKIVPPKNICTRRKIDEGFRVLKLSLVANVAFIYWLIYRRRQKMYIDREPQHRPCYRPGTMKPLLAKTFVNLSRVSILRRETVLDPFCGVGGFAIEACLMGLEAICSDIDEHMVRGAQVNIARYGCCESVDAIQMDAALEAIANLRVDGIATDPPYNIQSAPRGAKSLTDLLISFIDEASNVLRNGRYMVFATPIHIGRSIENALSESGFKIIEKHLDMVHGSLTRAIYVVKKI